MLKVIIADDEILEREVYKVLINRHFPELQVVAEAETGRQAIELFEKFRPDLILMDVKMPGINGIEAINEIRRKSRDAKFVIISAYNYFDYAKEALKNSVEDYLLKPVVKDEFIVVLNKILKKVEEEARLNKEELEMREKLKSILPILEAEVSFAVMMGDDSKIKQYTSLLNIDISRGYIVIGMVNDESFVYKDEIAINLTLKKIQEYIKENMPELRPALISDFISRKIKMIFPIQSDEQIEYMKDIAYKKVLKVRNTIRDTFGVKMSFGISEIYNSLLEITDKYNQALSVINNIDCFGMDIVNYGDIKCEIAKEFQYPYEMEKQLLEKMRLGLTVQSLEVFTKIFDYTTECLKGDTNKVKFELLELYFAMYRMDCETDFEDIGLRNFVMSKEKYFNLDSIHEVKHIFEEDTKIICDRFKEARNAKTKNIIYDAVKYIKRNYMKEITLEEVSKKVCVSPNYFSRIFKSEFNKNFIDYITIVRIEAAKDYILKTNKSIRDICWEVGYNDPNYFTKVFKKITNLTPSEFKENNKLQK